MKISKVFSDINNIFIQDQTQNDNEIITSKRLRKSKKFFDPDTKNLEGEFVGVDLYKQRKKKTTEEQEARINDERDFVEPTSKEQNSNKLRGSISVIKSRSSINIHQTSIGQTGNNQIDQKKEIKRIGTHEIHEAKSNILKNKDTELEIVDSPSIKKGEIETIKKKVGRPRKDDLSSNCKDLKDKNITNDIPFVETQFWYAWYAS